MIERRLNHGIVQIRSFVAWNSNSAEGTARLASQQHDNFVRHSFGQLNVAYIPRAIRENAAAPNHLPDLYLGDGSEIDAADFLTNCASGVPIHYDSAQQALSIATSIVGLPPVFLYRSPEVTAVTSDIHLLLAIPAVRLELDAHSVMELAHIGHPVEHRTLFRNLSIVESGVTLRLGSDGNVNVTRSWQLPDRKPLDWGEFVEAQIATFTSAVQKTNVERTFLSLTAGLDTRTVFATLAAQHRLMPAATMTGPRQLSLDAMTAKRLCDSYGIEHFAVTFADDFSSGLPQLLEDASRLSGGLATLDQAPELHMYRQLGPRFQARLSGNLGNQVGRGGTEGVSTRSADTSILSDQFANGSRTDGAHQKHWLLSKLNDTQRARLEFILQNEIVLTLVGNFTIGNHFAAQQTPYANRGLIETLALRPLDRVGSPSGSKLRMRVRDLAHRFFGEPEDRSFQRTLVRRIGGFASNCPVNWGWRPSGGLSPTGFTRGAATMAGMYARAKGLDNSSIPGAAALARLAELHDFRDARHWLRVDLRDYVHDTFGSRAVRESALFDLPVLATVVREHFQGTKDHYHTIVFALDIALAHRIFAQHPAQ